MKTSTTAQFTRQRKLEPPANSKSASSGLVNQRQAKKSCTSNVVRQAWGEALTQHDLDLLEKSASNPNRHLGLPDIPEIKEIPLANRRGILTSGLFKPYRQQVTLRIDADVLAWARRDGEGYQTLINAVLRQAMLEDLKSDGATSC